MCVYIKQKFIKNVLSRTHLISNEMNVKVFYFPLKGLAEGIRMILAYKSQEFEDCRINDEEWPNLKPIMPFGQMPVLEIDGKQYAQTGAILRYLGHKYGLAGNDVEEDFEIDQNIEFFNDIRLKAATVFRETDEKKKEAMQEELEKNYYPVVLAKLNEILSQNNGHMALGKLSWADFMFAGLYEGFKMILYIPDIDQKYQNFKKLHDRVVNLPKVKEFCYTSPKSLY